MNLSTRLDDPSTNNSRKVNWFTGNNIKLKGLSSFFATLSLVSGFLFQLSSASAQFTGCTGCTANDDHVISAELVQLNPAYATDNTQPQYISLPATCSGTSTVTGYLKITFDQNATTRYGIRLAGNILVNGVYSSTFTYKDADRTEKGTFVKYIGAFPIEFTCGTQLSLQNLFIAWGNSSSTNAYYQSETCEAATPHCEQLPLVPGDPPIIIVTPLSANFTYSGTCPAGKTAQTYSFDALLVPGGTTGGTPPYQSNAYSWSIKNASNTEVATMSGFTPTYDFSTLGAGAYTVTLTVTDDNPTASSSISRDINVVSCCTTAPNAGTNGTLTICAGTTPSNADLFVQLGGSPDAGGTWSQNGNVWTYTVNATAPCTGSAAATVTVTTQAQPNAGTNGTLTVCAETTPSNDDLFAGLNGSPDAGGTWSQNGNVWTYTVNATAPCTGSATATVTVTTQAQPNAGANGTLTICAGTTVTGSQLFAALGGTPSTTGIWSPTLAGAGTYTYTVAPTSPCTVNATATVRVTTSPNSICSNYNGDYFANTGSTATGGSAVVTLKYNISGNSSSSCNNISTLAVGDFKLDVVKDNTISTVALVAGYPTYSGGVYTAKYTITLSSTAYSGTVQFTLGTTNPNFSISGNCSDNPLVTVSTKSVGFVTGGGFIVPANSGGNIGGASVNGLKNNFGFNIKASTTGKLQGNWNTIIRRRENGQVVVYQVKSNTASSLVVTKISATSSRADMTFTSANFQNLTCSLCPVNANNGTVLVSVYDNGEPGAGVDKILITIKDKNGNVWYTSDAAANHNVTYTNVQLLNQGNIQVHTLAKREAAIVVNSLPEKLSVSAAPNPFTNVVRFTIQSPVSGKGSLDIYNLMGQKLYNVYNGHVTAGAKQMVEFNAPSKNSGSLIYSFKVGGRQVNGKIIQIK